MAALYGEPEVGPLMAALSFSFVLTAIGATQQSLLLREMNFRRLELMTMAGSLAGGAAAVVVAVLGQGAWAIISQALVTAALSSALYWKASSWRPKFSFSRASARDLWGFSGYLMGHRFLYYLHQNADNFLIGRYIGPAALGTYAVAYNVMLTPASRIGGPLQRVLAPAFSRMQDEPERIAAAWARVTRLIGAIAIPGMVALVIVAPDFVPVVLGSQWDNAVPVIQILAWVGILQALQSIDVDILMARDRTAHAVPVRDLLLQRARGRVHHRAALGDHRRGRGLRHLQHLRRAGADRDHRPRPRRLALGARTQHRRSGPGRGDDGRGRAGHPARAGGGRRPGGRAPGRCTALVGAIVFGALPASGGSRS